jgi:hypothetical protein
MLAATQIVGSSGILRVSILLLSLATFFSARDDGPTLAANEQTPPPTPTTDPAAIPLAQRLAYYHGPPPPRQPSNADVTWGIVLVIMAVLHIGMIFSQTSPYVDLCIVIVPLGRYFWPVVAFSVALCMAGRAANPRFGSFKRIRLILAALLVLFGIDTLTGGNYRWFELAMRHEMAKVGGPAALQAWGQSSLSSTEKIAAFDKDGGGILNPNQVPPALQHWFGHGGPMYRMSQDGGPAFQFDNGGWDMGWGVIVGRTDLTTAYPRGINGGNGYWTKQLQPGVFLYAFPF